MFAAEFPTWNGAVAGVMLLAVVLTVPVSLFLLRRYRRAVEKSMRQSASNAPAPPPQQQQQHAPVQHAATTTAPAPVAAPPPASSLRIEILDPDGDIEIMPDAATLYRRATTTPRRAALVYALAGFVFSLVTVVIHFNVAGISFMPWRTTIIVWLFMWPIVPTVMFVAADSRRFKLFLVLAYLVPYFLIITLYRISFDHQNTADLIGLLFIEIVPTVLLLLLIANKWLRSVAPLVYVGMIPIVGGVLYFPEAALALHGFASPGSTSGELRLLILTTFLVMLVLGTVGALLLLKFVARRYERKKSSEQSILLNTCWLLYAQIKVMTAARMLGALAVLDVLPILAFWLMLRLGLKRFRDEARRARPARLLLLRVFGSQRRSERLLDQLGLHWRYIGSIQMIAGTDLATKNLEPHEFLSFLTGRLNRRFVKGHEDLEQRVAAMDGEPDPDGRYRVNEFFCHDDTWRAALVRLVAHSDAVLMDLRGFSRQNQGCLFELQQLVNVVPVARVVLTVDDTTDLHFLQVALQHMWQAMETRSPNRDAHNASLRLLRVTKQNTRALRQLLRMLCAATTQPAAHLPQQQPPPRHVMPHNAPAVI